VTYPSFRRGGEFRRAQPVQPAEEDGPLAQLRDAVVGCTKELAFHSVADLGETADDGVSNGAVLHNQHALHVFHDHVGRPNLADEVAEAEPQTVPGVRRVALADRAEALARWATGDQMDIVQSNTEKPLDLRDGRLGEVGLEAPVRAKVVPVGP
jgi:hypothetical protein